MRGQQNKTASRASHSTTSFFFCFKNISPHTNLLNRNLFGLLLDLLAKHLRQKEVPEDKGQGRVGGNIGNQYRMHVVGGAWMFSAWIAGSSAPWLWMKWAPLCLGFSNSPTVRLSLLFTLTQILYLSHVANPKRYPSHSYCHTSSESNSYMHSHLHEMFLTRQSKAQLKPL